MPSIISMLPKKLTIDFPQFTFKAGDQFRWAPDTRTIYFDQASTDNASLLHELSHALLQHTSYTRDIQLIEMERDAWQYATEQLAYHYAVDITDDTVQDALDSYRDWLHARSTCPTCRATGVQTGKQHYKCLACATTWKVNDARVCALRRYKQI